ncbi:uncharacterized protein LOC131068350 [Cryptomeria japonica]|uniref:uncharacterized protein LOC131068350 n=1 Tax=Cryptomeria japonica TaxID=3369 RepID=UPI0027DA3FEA|nr:uncharacterized protein LOC131068350 [Cryptomeria japonica]
MAMTNGNNEYENVGLVKHNQQNAHANMACCTASSTSSNSSTKKPMPQITVTMRIARRKFERFLQDGTTRSFSWEISHAFTWNRQTVERTPFEVGLVCVKFGEPARAQTLQ